jgi:hypothetical protein
MMGYGGWLACSEIVFEYQGNARAGKAPVGSRRGTKLYRSGTRVSFDRGFFLSSLSKGQSFEDMQSPVDAILKLMVRDFESFELTIKSGPTVLPLSAPWHSIKSAVVRRPRSAVPQRLPPSRGGPLR